MRPPFSNVLFYSKHPHFFLHHPQEKKTPLDEQGRSDLMEASAAMKKVAVAINEVTRQRHLSEIMYGEIRLTRSAPLNERLTGLPFDMDTLGDLMDDFVEAVLVQEKQKTSPRRVLVFQNYIMGCKRREGEELAVKELYELANCRCTSNDRCTFAITPLADPSNASVYSVKNIDVRSRLAWLFDESSARTVTLSPAPPGHTKGTGAGSGAVGGGLAKKRVSASDASDAGARGSMTGEGEEAAQEENAEKGSGESVAGSAAETADGTPPAGSAAAGERRGTNESSDLAMPLAEGSPSATRKGRGLASRFVAARDRVFSTSKQHTRRGLAPNTDGRRSGPSPTHSHPEPRSPRLQLEGSKGSRESITDNVGEVDEDGDVSGANSASRVSGTEMMNAASVTEPAWMKDKATGNHKSVGPGVLYCL